MALAVLGAAVVAGVVNAQSSPAPVTDLTTTDLAVPAPGSFPNVGEALPACSNSEDDDGDELVDLDDPECSGSLDDDEEVPGDERGEVSEDETPTREQEPVPAETEPAVKPDPDKGGKGDGGSGKGQDEGGSKGHDGDPDGGGGAEVAPRPPRRDDGSPTRSNPTLSIAQPGAAPIGVPNFMIDQFQIPPFLLPIYQACGTQYGIPWQVLASINRIETAFGTNLNVSSAGAMGWMQFIPSSWRAYGTDANRDGRKDPYNPVDAICAAARYLKAAGAEQDLRRAIFAYNHADWYVDEVLLYARQYGKLPSTLISSLTGLTEGAHFPVAARARYADDISERQAAKRSKPTAGTSGNAADVISSSPTRRGIDIFAKDGAPVVAVNDGVIKDVGSSKQLGNYVVLEDAFGNRYTYAGLGEVNELYPVPKERKLTAKDFELVSPEGDAKPSGAATGSPEEGDSGSKWAGPVNTEDSRDRLYALPERPNNVDRAELSGQLDGERAGRYETFKASASAGVLEFDPKTMETRRLRAGAKVVAGTVLGRIGKTDAATAPHVHFAIRPAGRGAKKIDPKPILDGWKLLEATAIYRAQGKDPFRSNAGVGQVLLMSKGQLEQRVLSDPRLEIYSCGRDDIRTGQIDRRILAALEYLVERGYRLTITSLKCGHSFYTSSGNVSAHSSGNAVDIAAINGIPVLGHQGRGSITEAVVLDLMKLQGNMEPAQIITLMELGGPTFAMGDHADHIHLGYTPTGLGTEATRQYTRLLKPEQWERLIDRIGELDQPTVRTKPSRIALPSGKRVHRGD
jgi:murein DD-endopeptidase MepM/ murein hydrolase activator NlpD